jgi:hypothetical protein
MATSVSATTTRKNIWAFIQPAEKQRADKTAQHLSRKLPQENRPQESAKGKRGENKGVGKCARYVAAVEAEPTWVVTSRRCQQIESEKARGCCQVSIAHLFQNRNRL